MFSPKVRQYLFCVAICSVIFACGSDDEDTVTGTWYATLLESTNCTDPFDNINLSDLSTDACTETSADGCVHYEYVFTETTFTYSATATELGQVISFSGAGTYTFDGNSITLCEDGDCDTANITLDGNTAEITGNSPDDGCENRLVLMRK